MLGGVFALSFFWEKKILILAFLNFTDTFLATGDNCVILGITANSSKNICNTVVWMKYIETAFNTPKTLNKKKKNKQILLESLIWP